MIEESEGPDNFKLVPNVADNLSQEAVETFKQEQQIDSEIDDWEKYDPDVEELKNDEAVKESTSLVSDDAVNLKLPIDPKQQNREGKELLTLLIDIIFDQQYINM